MGKNPFRAPSLTKATRIVDVLETSLKFLDHPDVKPLLKRPRDVARELTASPPWVTDVHDLLRRADGFNGVVARKLGHIMDEFDEVQAIHAFQVLVRILDGLYGADIPAVIEKKYQSRYEALPGRLIPVHFPHLDPKSFGLPSARAEEWKERPYRFRLADESFEDIQVIIDMESRHQLAHIPGRIGLCSPHKEARQQRRIASVHSVPTWDHLELGGTPDYVRVLDEEGNNARVAAGTRTALASGSCAVVLPELSATPSTVEAVPGLMEADPGLLMMIAGSALTRCDLAGDDERCNVSSIFLQRSSRRPGVVRYEHHKFSHMTIDAFDWDEPNHVPDKPTIVLKYLDKFALCVLICSDVLDPRLEHLLPRLPINLLVVPALSPYTTNFDVPLGRLRGRWQTFSIVVNGVTRNWPSSQGSKTAGAQVKVMRPSESRPASVLKAVENDRCVGLVDLVVPSTASIETDASALAGGRSAEPS